MGNAKANLVTELTSLRRDHESHVDASGSAIKSLKDEISSQASKMKIMEFSIKQKTRKVKMLEGQKEKLEAADRAHKVNHQTTADTHLKKMVDLRTRFTRQGHVQS